MTKTPPREPCRRDAAFVAWILRTMPDYVFPHGPDTNPEGDNHLVLSVALNVDALAECLSNEDDGTEEFAAYRCRVVMCADVMAGKLSAPPESMWEAIAKDYGRGRYLSHKAHLRRPQA